MDQDAGSPLADAQLEALARQFAEIEAALEARVGSEVDAVVDPASGRTLPLRRAWDKLQEREVRLEQERESLRTQSLDDRQALRGLGAALVAERDLLETIMENTQAHLAYLDPNFRFVRVNETYARGSGYSREALIGHYHFDLFPDAENQTIFEQVRNSGQPFAIRAKPFTFAERPELGTTYWDWTLVPVLSARDQVQGLVFSLLDVTEQERARLEREARLERLTLLQEVSQHVLSETTVEGILQRVVGAACELTRAQIGASGHDYTDGAFCAGATWHREQPSSYPPKALFQGQYGGAWLELIQDQASVRLTQEELEAHPAWRGLPEGHPPLRGLLGVRLTGRGGQAVGLIMVSDKAEGQFTAEDEALLGQLAALASLALQHVEARQEAERRANELEAVLQAMADGVVVYDTQRSTARANAAATNCCEMDLVGKSEEESCRLLQVSYPDGRPVPPDELPASRVLRGVQVQSQEFHLMTACGRAKTVQASATPLLSDGQVSGVVTIWRDVTEQVLTRKRIEELAVRNEAVLESMTEGLILIDLQGNVIDMNPAALRMQGCERIEEAQSHFLEYASLFEVYDLAGQPLPVDEWPITRLLRGERFTNLEVRERFLWSGQTWIASYGGTLVHDPHSNPILGLLTMRDVTERKEAEEQLHFLHGETQRYALELEERVRARTQELTTRTEELAAHTQELARRTVALEISEARFRAIFEEAAIGIALVDRKGRLLSANPALQGILGYSAQELEGASLESLAAPGGDRQADGLFTELMAGQRSHYLLEQRFVRKDSEVIDVDAVLSCVRPRKGRARFAIAMIEDVTARKRAREALIQAEKLSLSGRLAASMAHEINNPLQSVIGCLGLAQEMLAAGEDPGRYMQVAMEELERAARIVHQLRDLNRRRQFDKESTDINGLVERTLLLTQKRCQGRHVEVTWEGAQGLPSIMLAPDRIQQILLNLVLNAVDAMPEGGRLHIRTQHTNGPPGVEIMVSDTGVGIPAERLAVLFEPFQSTKEMGMGMGLYVSREIILEHGGHIDVQSEIGRGTTFTIWLPDE